MGVWTVLLYGSAASGLYFRGFASDRRRKRPPGVQETLALAPAPNQSHAKQSNGGGSGSLGVNRLPDLHHLVRQSALASNLWPALPGTRSGFAAWTNATRSTS